MLCAIFASGRYCWTLFFGPGRQILNKTIRWTLVVFRSANYPPLSQSLAGSSFFRLLLHQLLLGAKLCTTLSNECCSFVQLYALMLYDKYI
jgi:hypothetical protein